MKKEEASIDEIDPTGLEGFLTRIKPVLSAQDYALAEKLVKTLLAVTGLVRLQGTTVSRLRRFLGMKKSEKAADLIAQGKGPEGPDDPDGAGGGKPESAHPDSTGAAATGSEPSKVERKGHGRLSSSAFPNAHRHRVSHEELRAGDRCPGCGKGTLFELEKPAEFLRIVGQAPLHALCWECQRLRCSGCGLVFTAKAPAEAQGQKYDETAIAMMAVLHYGSGMPHERLEKLQGDLRTPLPAATQSEVLKESTDDMKPVFEELTRQAAHGRVFFVDDTSVQILEYSGKRRKKLEANGKLENPERTGMHTTAIVSRTENGHAIALVRSGRKHAGENFSDLLDLRDKTLPAPIHMCDALACNAPKGHGVVECNCLVHARRGIVDEIENFPKECTWVIEMLGKVFATDEECHRKGLCPQARLEVHQRRSRPVMEALKGFLEKELEERRVEPNSGLGKAFNYMLKRWDKLTVFLRAPGAPLDNNAAERVLKMAIRHRNNSLFFLTQRGAEVADVYMTLIYTAQLQGENPFEYLTALLRHSRATASSPADWLPWTFRKTLALLAGHKTPEALQKAA